MYYYYCCRILQLHVLLLSISIVLFPTPSVQSFVLSTTRTSNFPSYTITTTKWGIKQQQRRRRNHDRLSKSSTLSTPTTLYFFDKVFEEEGSLGKGITVGKVQVALQSPNRDKNSIFQMLQDNARWIENDDDSSSLADLAHDVCISLLRKKDYWTAACSNSQWFSMKDSGKAEALYNEWSNIEAAKFEKQYIPDGTTTDGESTIVVVSLVIEIEGDSTKFDGAGYSISGTQAVLNSIASNCKVDDGEVTRAVEVFWTPSDPTEVITSRDIIVDFPELIDV